RAVAALRRFPRRLASRPSPQDADDSFRHRKRRDRTAATRALKSLKFEARSSKHESTKGIRRSSPEISPDLVLRTSDFVLLRFEPVGAPSAHSPVAALSPPHGGFDAQSSSSLVARYRRSRVRRRYGSQ